MAKKRSAFGAAFAKARKEQGANGVFTYKGKKYSTRRADDPPKNSIRGGKTPRATLDRPEKPTAVRPEGQPQATGVGGLGAKTIAKEGRAAAKKQDARVDARKTKQNSMRSPRREMSVRKIEEGERGRDAARADQLKELMEKAQFSKAAKGMESEGFRAGGMAKKKPVKKNMGGMMKYNKGGKVRGAGKVMKGVRAATMVSMKGS